VRIISDLHTSPVLYQIRTRLIPSTEDVTRRKSLWKKILILPSTGKRCIIPKWKGVLKQCHARRFMWCLIKCVLEPGRPLSHLSCKVEWYAI